MGAKQQRQHRIAGLLEEHRVTNQAQLVDLLAGIRVGCRIAGAQ